MECNGGNAAACGESKARGAARRLRRASRPTVSALLAAVMAFGPAGPWLKLTVSEANAQAGELDNVARSKLPLADPVIDSPAEFKAHKVNQWSEGAAQLMLLDGDVSFATGSYGFRGNRAVVRIDTERQHGRAIRHISIYFDNATPLHGRGPVSAESPRLLVTVSTTGKLGLETDGLLNESKAGDELAVEANGRFRQHLATIAGSVRDVPPMSPLLTKEMTAKRAQRHEEIDEDLKRRATASLQTEAIEQGVPPAQPAPTPGVPGVAGVPEASQIMPASGLVSFSAGRVVVQPNGKNETTITLMGHVRVFYQSFEGRPGATLTAENAVIFLGAGNFADLASRKFKASDVKGVYLEDNVVATYDRYTVRAPRVFYDLSLNKAVVLDAVMFTWDVRRNIPIYVRAEKMKQESATLWTADRATVTTSEFAVPHFAIAARQVTVQQEERNGEALTTFTGRDTTARVGGVPVFYWPKVSGDAADIALKRADVAYNSDTGPNVKTVWDVFTLTGKGLTVRLGMVSDDRFFESAHEQRLRPERLKVSNIPGLGAVHVRWLVEGSGPYTVTVTSVKGGRSMKQN